MNFFVAICVSHAAHLHQLANNFHFTEDDVVLCYSTLHWQTGLFMLLTGPLLGTTRIITTEPFSAEQQLYTIEKYKVNAGKSRHLGQNNAHIYFLNR